MPPKRWKIWSLPRPALAYVLAVDVVAALAIALSATEALPGSGPSRSEWLTFAVLAVASIAHLEAARGIERQREKAANTSPHVNLKSLWVFAGTLLLPLSLVVTLVLLAYGYSWLRVYGPAVAHRKIFSASTYVIASLAAAAVLHVGGLPDPPRAPTGPWTLLIVLAAAAVWWLVNYALVVGAILLSSPETPVREALGELADQVVVAAALGLGIAVAALQLSHPWVVPVLMVTILALHRDVLLPQFRRAATTDAKTGLASASLWSISVPAELARASTLRSTVGMLMLDLDDFKNVNDTFGHPAGDQALRAAGDAIQSEVRRVDMVARVGGDEIAVLLPGVELDEVLEIAERIRRRLAKLTVVVPQGENGETRLVEGVPASIGAAVYPSSGTDMDQLVLAADAALMSAKQAGRNRVVPALNQAV